MAKWVPEDCEWELFNYALGDNQVQKIQIRTPKLPGITTAALFQLTRLAEEFHFLRRRSTAKRHHPEDIIVFYEVTGTGKKIINILEAIEDAKKKSAMWSQELVTMRKETFDVCCPTCNILVEATTPSSQRSGYEEAGDCLEVHPRKFATKRLTRDPRRYE